MRKVIYVNEDGEVFNFYQDVVGTKYTTLLIDDIDEEAMCKDVMKSRIRIKKMKAFSEKLKSLGIDPKDTQRIRQLILDSKN